jgi:hypothetical protein
MKLLLGRSQRNAGLMGGKVMFTLDARVDLTDEEKALIKKYGLGKEVIYNSEKSKRHLEATQGALAMPGAGSLLKAGIGLAMAALSLNITIESLTKGHHIECKDLDELLATEQAIMEACRNIKVYLDTAVTFDGREVVIDFDKALPAA